MSAKEYSSIFQPIVENNFNKNALVGRKLSFMYVIFVMNLFLSLAICITMCFIVTVQNHVDEKLNYLKFSIEDFKDEGRHVYVDNNSQEHNSKSRQIDFLDALIKIDDELLGDEASINMAIGQLEHLLSTNESNTDVLYRLGNAYYYLSTGAQVANNMDKLAYYVTKGLQYAEKSIKLNNSCFECEKSFVEVFGTKIDNLASVSEKFKNNQVFIDKLELLERLNPDHWFVFGYKAARERRIAELSWFERNVGAIVVRNMDFNYSYDNIIYLYKKALERGAPKIHLKIYTFYIGQAHVNKGDFDTGYKLVKESIDMPTISPMDLLAQKEIDKFMGNHLEKYQKYLADNKL